MSGRTIIAIVAVSFWIGTCVVFFKRDMLRWWQNRPQRRIRAEREARQQAEARTRMLDELARKYGVPEQANPATDKRA